MHRKIILSVALVSLTLVATGCAKNKTNDTVPPVAKTPSASPSAAANPNETTVNYTSSGFDPKTVTVKVGMVVNFVNKAKSPMQVSSDPHPSHTAYRLLNGPTTKVGAEFSVVPDKKGSWGVHDHLNPSAQMTLVVQ